MKNGTSNDHPASPEWIESEDLNAGWLKSNFAFEG
jgi:hypothetical protein